MRGSSSLVGRTVWLFTMGVGAGDVAGTPWLALLAN